MKICTPFTVLRSQFLSRESITSLLTAGARTRAACQSSALIGQGTRIRDLWLVNHTFIATPQPVQCSVNTAKGQCSGDGKERETHDTWRYPRLWLRVYPDNPELFHWKLIMSPETQVQVSGIVLESSFFLWVFIQACGEGQIVAVMARFFGIMKTDIHHTYLPNQAWQCGLWALWWWGHDFWEIPDKGMVP